MLTLVLATWGIPTQSVAQDTSGAEQNKPDPSALLPGKPSVSIPEISSLDAWLQKRGLRAEKGQSLRSGATLQTNGEPRSYSVGTPVRIAGSSSPSKRTPEQDVTIRRNENGTPRLIRGAIAPEVQIPTAASRMPKRSTGDARERFASKSENQLATRGLEALAPMATRLRLQDPASELRPIDAWTDDARTTHVRYKQVYEGLPVWGRELVLHADDTGFAYAVTSAHAPTPRLSTTTPGLSSEKAQTAAQRHLASHGVQAKASSSKRSNLPTAIAERHPENEARLVIYASDSSPDRLAYEVRTVTGFFQSHLTIIDATSGEVLTSFAEQCTLHGGVHEDGDVHIEDTSDIELPSGLQGYDNGTGSMTYNAAPAAVAGTFVDATGTDLTGATRSFRAYQGSNGIYRLISDLDNFDGAASTLPPEGVDPNGGSITLSLNDQDFEPGVSQTEITSLNGTTWNHPAAVSAHTNAEITYSYFKNTYGRLSIDNNDGTFYSIVDVTRNGAPMDNAFWHNGVMAYGDGNTQYEPLAEALDVAAHEMTHGVIDNSANLQYQFQSGALNESFADVFGVMVDRDDFFVGEEIALNATALRDIADPTNPNVISPQPDDYADYVDLTIDQDKGGVHVNSGIPNRAAYLVIQSIGRTKAEQIYYRALTTYLNPTSNFLDARDALVQSAGDLYGSVEVNAVQQAFDAVGIIPDNISTEDPSANDVPPIVDGTPAIAFVSTDGTVGTYNPSNGSATNYSSAVAFQAGDAFSKLSTPTAGNAIWFVDGNGYLAFVDLATGDVFNYPDLYIQQPGDLRSAAIAPDGSAVALVSAYTQDDQLYIWTGGTLLGALPIQPPTTQEDLNSETVSLLDVVDWSPNTNTPALVVDAFNEVGSGSTALTFWDIHEVDFSSEAITPLFGSPPGNISLGNPAYSNTDPDVTGFNVVNTDTGVYDILLSNGATGAFAGLGISSYTYDGQPITDAQRPTFAPDDSEIVFSSPTNNALLFFDISAGSLSAQEFTTAVYNPHWFREGGERLPVELAVFNAQLDGTSAELRWTTASETANAGFYVEHQKPRAERWIESGFVEGQGTTTEATTYRYAIDRLQAGTHRFRLRQIDIDGTETRSETVSIQVLPTDPIEIIVQSSPSPSPSASVTPRSSGPLTVRLYDILGRQVNVLYQGRGEAGQTINVDLSRRGLSSGSYFIRVRAGEAVATERLTVIR